MKLIICRGIPGSGKSTWAKSYCLSTDAVRVSRDDIRVSTFGRSTGVDEDAVTKIEDAMVEAALKAGKSVVVDDTNIRHAYVKRFASIGQKFGADVAVMQFDIDVEEAIRRVKDRAANGGLDVPEKVIRDMHRRLKMSGRVELEEETAFKPYVPHELSAKAILVDVDGTLAHNNGHRGFYEYERVGNDEVIEVIAEMVRRYCVDHTIIVMSGRDDSCERATRVWLNDNNIPFDAIYMRRTGDKRKDTIVKIELFDKHVRDNYNVQFVLDDRASVVEAWRSIGLRVLQVAPGDF